MSRVFLMVQGAGDKRPKCQAWCECDEEAGIEWTARVVRQADAYGLAGKRYWLVEAANAEAGRAVIAENRLPWDERRTEGRILATGAREGGAK